MDVTHLLFFAFCTLLFIGGQWVFSAWYGGYRSVVDFYYCEINRNPRAGAWYYGRARASTRGGSVRYSPPTRSL